MPSDGRSPSVRPRVLVDTNGWLLPFRSGTDLAREIERLVPGSELAVPRDVLRELEELVRAGVAGARAALALARRAQVVAGIGRGDEAVVAAARPGRDWVVTADRALGLRLHALGVSILVPRDRSRLTARAAPPPSTPSRRPAARRRPGAS